MVLNLTVRYVNIYVFLLVLERYRSPQVPNEYKNMVGHMTFLEEKYKNVARHFSAIILYSTFKLQYKCQINHWIYALSCNFDNPF